MGFLLLLTLGACGGRSVSHVTDDDGGAMTDKAAPASDGGGCVSLCDACGIDTMVGTASCEDFCEQVDRQAVDAECGTVLDDFVRCRNASMNTCSLRACADETNRLTVCVLTYCDSYSDSARALCSAW
jgi:hypothetical protein